MEAPDLLAKGLTPVRVAGSHLQCGAGHAQRPGGARQTLGDHHLVEHGRRPVLRTDEVRRRDPCGAEGYASRAPTPRAHQAIYVFDIDTRSPLNQEGAQSLVGPGLCIGAGIHQQEIRSFGANHKPLLPLKHKGIAVAAGRGRRPKKVRAAPGFGQRFGHRHPAVNDGAQPALLLGRRTKDVNGLAADARQ